MASFSQLLIVLLLCAPLCLFFLQKWRRDHAPTSRKTLPPSPPKLPVVGNLHQVGSLPHRSLQSLSRRYGPLMLLHLGSVPTVVVSSSEAAREIMKNQGSIFSNRPKLNIPGRVFYNHKDVAFSPYGDYWRRMRSICVLQLLSTKRVQSYRVVREEETSAMVEKIMKVGPTAAVNLTDVLMSVMNDVVCRVALGKKWSRERDFKKQLAEVEVLMVTSPVWEYIPWLAWTRRFDGVDERIERAIKGLDEFLEIVIQEHKAAHIHMYGEREKDGELDFVDILLQSQRENENSSSHMEDDTVKAIILDIFLAGSATAVSIVEWGMAELIKNPRTMKKLQKEVREAAGKKGGVEEEDLEKMPYLKAVMKESLRLHSPIPLLLPRESTQDTKVLGYDVASGTRVVINAWAIARDPSLWENPEEFYPERFLETSIDYKGLNFELIPFGAGRRGCPGQAFAVAINELALAKLVHSFDFGLLPNEAKLDMSESIGLSVRKKFPLLVLATPHAL